MMSVNLKKLVVLMLFLFAGSAQAMEKTGDLVFNAVQEMGEQQTSYLDEIEQVKSHREVVQDKVAQLKTEILDLPAGTPAVDRKSLEARFAKNLALNIKSLIKELEITGRYAGRHASTLYSLMDSLESNQGALSKARVDAIVGKASPVLQNSRELYMSLAKYKDSIKDPVVLNKLQQANSLAQTWHQYMKMLKHNNSNNASSRKRLVLKVKELLEKFNSISCETEVLTAMLEEETATLKLVNQIKTYELIEGAFAGTGEIAGALDEKHLGPIKENMGGVRSNVRFISSTVTTGDTGGKAGISQAAFPDAWPQKSSF